MVADMRDELRIARLLRTAILLLPLTWGCASASAKSKPADSPPLNVPPAPERIIEPAPEPQPEPVNELPATPTSPPPTRPNRPREQPRSTPPEPKAGEQKPVELPPPEPAPVAQPSAQPPAQLSTPQTADAATAARTIRAMLDRANGLLKGVNYGPLSYERKKAYDDAKRFIQQAEEALKQGNFPFAQGVATKAETLARELAGK